MPLAGRGMLASQHVRKKHSKKYELLPLYLKAKNAIFMNEKGRNCSKKCPSNHWRVPGQVWGVSVLM
jgi:hypothetical protein